MSKLAEKIRRARERVVPDIDGHTYTIRRPTDEDVLFGKVGPGLGMVRAYVIGWDFKELDLVPGGGPEAVPFDAEAWGEWVADKPAVWDRLSDAIVGLYKEHVATLEADAKN